MGIPSYFSYIIRKHPYIITKLPTRVDNLYLDSNSIIYDIVNTMQPMPNFEDTLIQLVCEKIDYYLNLVRPQRVFIAFDGVPPMAKIKQQRERRYKSWILSKMTKESTKWNTLQITPGTAFMNQLDKSLHSYFNLHRAKYSYFKLSTSQEEGEGEHKIFSHIRKVPGFHQNQITLIYGLDSDLIVLALNHLKYGNIQLLREAPAFMLDDKELHVLDITKLADGIVEMIGPTKLPDYIFMTLLLGNDFMPHFPALNLRTSGFDTLLQTYTSCIAPDEYLFNGKHICWTVVKKLILALSEKEHSIFIKDYTTRNNFRVDTSTDEKRINNLPMLQREKEHYICPIKPGWEQRYYDTLLPNVEMEELCKNYTDMLIWNMTYYTTGCTDWGMKYKYMYPPLLVDLAKHIPEMSIISYYENTMTPEMLLRYVLPPPYYHYIPNGECTESACPTLEWSYCRYTWESHVNMK